GARARKVRVCEGGRAARLLGVSQSASGRAAGRARLRDSPLRKMGKGWYTGEEVFIIERTAQWTPRAGILTRRRHGKESSSEEEAERRVHEAGSTERRAVGGRGLEGDAAHRGHQEAVGLHQEERPAGQEEQADDQVRRCAEAGVRR